MKQLNVVVPEELYRAVRHYCVDADTTVRAIVKTHLEKLVKQPVKRKALADIPRSEPELAEARVEDVVLRHPPNCTCSMCSLK